MYQTPSAGQLAEIKLLVPGIADLINEAQLATLATNLTREDDAGTTLRQVLEVMVKAQAVTEEHLVDLVRYVNFQRLGPMLKQQEQLAIATQGFALQGVFSTKEGETDRAYTIGLSIRTGFEVFAMAGNDVNLLQAMVASYAKLALDGQDIEVPRNDLGGMRHQPNYGVRTVAVPVTDPEAIQRYLPGQPHPVTKVYQILIADKNNLLPNEQGYDTDWVQPLVG
jgi:hypothetical protein